jgi:hypothetical protein
MLRALLFVLTLLLLGCSDSTPSPDHGQPDSRTPDRPALGDRLAADHARKPEAQSPDAAPILPCATGLDLNPLQLDSNYCVAARFDLPQAPAAIALDSGHLYTLIAGGTPYLLQVKKHTISTGGQLGAAADFFTATVTDTGTIYPGEYLALAPDASSAAIGYTLYSTDGGMFWGTEGGAPTAIAKANGNYRAAFLDAKTLLIDGLGVGAAQDGQGVYVLPQGQAARRVVKDLGSLSGLLVLTDKAMLAGGYFGKGNQIFGFDRAAVSAAIQGSTQLSATDLVYSGEAADAATLDDDLVVARFDASYKVVAVSRVPITVSGGKVQAGSSVDIVTVPSGSTKVEKLASWRSLLALLITGGTSPQVALIRHK